MDVFSVDAKDSVEGSTGAKYIYNDTCMHMAVTVLIQSRDQTTCGTVMDTISLNHMDFPSMDVLMG